MTSGNCLTALPDSITRLSELQFLSVNSNQLAELPDDIGRLEKCVLQRRGNGVVARCGGGVADYSWVGVVWSLCPRLELLLANSNALTSLPSSLSSCKALKKVITPSFLDRRLG